MGKPPSWNEIRKSATDFASRWHDETEERAESQTFWTEFLGIFGIDRRRVATFEARAVRTSTGNRGRIDLFWPGTLIAEHKSAGKSLEDAEQQAIDYLDSIDQKDFPGVVITSNFSHLRIRDLGGDNIPVEFPLQDLPKEIDRFGFIAGYQVRRFSSKQEEEVNIAAAKLMGRLYEEIAGEGYEGHQASILMTRLLFILFADDSGVWEKDLFDEFIRNRTSADGSDVGPQLALLFQILDREPERRSDATDEMLKRFPYVNGGIFQERIDIPVFNKAMRDELLRCCDFSWASVSPAVLGSLFQALASKEARRVLGAHYTREHLIHRAIDPLLLDELRAEFAASRDNVQRLNRLHERLGRIRVFDPAAGCGNFLVVTYRELRRLEHDILARLQDLTGDEQMLLDPTMALRVRPSNFYAIEIDEWPARIAETALFLADHQANLELGRIFGKTADRLPIKEAATIVNGNALEVDWATVLPPSDDVVIVGNPPFVGMSMMTKEQQADNRQVFEKWAKRGFRSGRLDYVACWYAKAVDYIHGTRARVALVSTNSISQGEQARTLGPLLEQSGCDIDFAHQTFAWSSEAPGAAAVHCVIIGFSAVGSPVRKRLYHYGDIKGEPVEEFAKDINIYLANSSVAGIAKHPVPIVAVPKLTEGNRPQDGGGLIVEAEEYDAVMADQIASKYVRPLISAKEMLNSKPRYCLWLTDAEPQDIRSSQLLKDRLEIVSKTRRESPTESAREKAKTPSLFLAMRQPTRRWLCVPRVSSENRRIIPMAFFERDDIAHDTILTLDGADNYLFGILQSAMFTAWAKTVSGRLKSDIRLSPDITYNSFPFPTEVAPERRAKVEAAAQAVLDVRASYPQSSLADLYDSNAMPPALSKAHDALDAAVDAAFGTRKFASDSDRLAFLFHRYAEITAGAFAEPKKPHKS